MKQYLDLLQEILTNGIRQSNRTGIDTLTLPGAMLKFDLREGFPAVTTKKLAFNQVKGELIGFLRGCTNVKDFQELGCTVWDANANAPAWQDNPACKGQDDLGRIYGSQWRNWTGWDEMALGFSGSTVETRYSLDQIDIALNTLRNNPESRRILVNAWNPAELDQACLPPCHVLFQLLPHVANNTLHMTMYQRSCDMFLGVPFNIASYALLLHLFAKWSGFKVGTLTMFLADAHIYVNHIDQVKEQLSREPLKLPIVGIIYPEEAVTMSLDELLDNLEPEEIFLIDYEHYAAIKAPMAV